MTSTQFFGKAPFEQGIISSEQGNICDTMFEMKEKIDDFFKKHEAGEAVDFLNNYALKQVEKGGDSDHVRTALSIASLLAKLRDDLTVVRLQFEAIGEEATV